MSSMNIYPSTKSAPYVYLCTNRETEEFYIGYRGANVKKNLTSNVDLPLYKTSSKIVKPIFEEFDLCIIAEFFNSEDAYDFEQLLIFENWNNPLLLNQSCYYQKRRFRGGGRPKGTPCSESQKQKIRAYQKGRPKTAEQKARQSIVAKGKPSANKGKTYENIFGTVRAKLLKDEKSKMFKNRIFSAETKLKMKQNHSDVTGKNNPKALSGKFFDKDGNLLISFTCLKELEIFCRIIEFPFRGLKPNNWIYIPNISLRNKKFAKFFGYYVSFL